MGRSSSKFNVFKGPEKRLNLAIFLVLSLSGPLPALKIYKQIIAQKKLGGTHLGSLYRRLDRLVEEDYLTLLPPKGGSKVRIYELTNKVCLVMVLDLINEQELIDGANEQELGFLLASVLKIVVKD